MTVGTDGPRMLGAPLLRGTGRIGQKVTLIPGFWAGQTRLTWVWQRNGQDIPGATGLTYVPGPEDDLTALSCLVTAFGPAGTAVALAGPIRVTHIPPEARGELFEEIFDQEPGAQPVATAKDFTGAALRFSVEGAGARVDPGTGLVWIPTDRACAGEIVTVTAHNSGGTASSRFLVTIEAEGAEEAEFPLILAAAETAAAPPKLLPGAPDWRLLRYRSQAEVDAGIYYGDPEQFQQCVARSPSHPDRIYLGQDIGPIRRSDDGGATWRICVARGMKNAYFLGGAVDPVNPDVFMVQCGNRVSSFAQKQAGIWRTTDGGVTFERVQPVDPVGEPRIVADTMAFAPSLVEAAGARRWYAAFAARPIKDGTPVDSGFWQSDDYGVSWTRRTRSLPSEVFGEDVFRVAVSPTDPDRIWMGTSAGLFTSANAGADWRPVSREGQAARALAAAPPVPVTPVGACTHIEIDPDRPDRIFASFDGQGAYLTEDGFATAALELFASDILHRAFPHPADWNICIRLPKRGTGAGTFNQAEVSTNALARQKGVESSWTRIEVPPKPGSRNGWWREITAEPSAVRWDPRDPASAFASARGHLFRTGDRIHWDFSNEGVSGFNYGNASISTEFMFDPADADRILMPHADVGILATENGFKSYVSLADSYARVALRSASTKTTCNVCALQPREGSTRMVAAIGDYNTSTLVYSPDRGANWTRVGPSAGEAGKPIRCWSINYALSEPDHCYVGDQMSADGGETWQVLPALQALGQTMLVLGVSRLDAGASGPAIYAADHRGKAAYQKLWKSTDRGASWDLALAYPAGSLRGGFDAPVFRVDPIDPHAVIVAAPSGARGGVPGSVSRYDTRSGKWRHFNIWQALPREDGNAVSRIAIDWHRAALAPEEPLILYVQLVHVGMRNVLRSIDGGESWENMTHDSTNAVGQGFEVHPLTGELFSGGEAGTRMLQPPYAAAGTVGTRDWSRPNNIVLTP